jgi:hypothetical protein
MAGWTGEALGRAPRGSLHRPRAYWLDETGGAAAREAASPRFRPLAGENLQRD